MQNIRSRLNAAIILIGALLVPCSSPYAQSQTDTLPNQQLAGPQTPRSNQPVTAAASAAGPEKRISKNFTLKGDSDWIDTGIDVASGEHVVATAKGTMRYANAKEDNGPDGLPRGFKDLLRILPYNSAGRGALIGRVGDADVAQPFLLGSPETFTVAKSVTAVPGVDDSLFEKIPRRIADKAGNPGDMVNFLILGSETAMQNVFTAAGWVKVDSDVQNTILHGLISSLSKESYLTMPMSPLYLFGRSQDYGWAHAEPIDVVRSRNHLRIWKGAFTVNGETLWVGAATHDIGFERDERNNGLTHKIDPDIDLERDYVEKTLCGTGLVTQVFHFLPRNPMQEANTATGGSFHSNGQVLILKLAETAKDLSATSNR